MPTSGYFDYTPKRQMTPKERKELDRIWSQIIRPFIRRAVLSSENSRSPQENE